MRLLASFGLETRRFDPATSYFAMIESVKEPAEHIIELRVRQRPAFIEHRWRIGIGLRPHLKASSSSRDLQALPSHEPTFHFCSLKTHPEISIL
jgi:hypothetical protein